MAKKRALLSVFDKDQLESVGLGLIKLGFELISTGGTATALRKAGLAVTDVSVVTGFPEGMGGRVKSMHPMIQAGILARRSNYDDMEFLRSHGIVPIDVVICNLYPFAATAANAGATAYDLIENIDIGGPTMIRAAAKNFQDVLVAVDPKDYARLLGELGREGGTHDWFHLDLMRKAFAHTAAYDAAISQEFNTGVSIEKNTLVRLRKEKK
jgi:phosphoribosylaminoimidazolecarboxamide formyltransferase/IMP cyclohydrolase